MTFKKAIISIISVLVINTICKQLGIYDSFELIDIPMHFLGGVSIGMFGLAIWMQGIHEVKFRGWFARHLEWWLVPIFVLGVVSFVGILWEWHEYLLDWLTIGDVIRQPDMKDTMTDFLMDILGGSASLIFYKRK